MLIIRRLLYNNQGSAGVLALIAMIFLGGLGGALYTLSSSELKTSSNIRDITAAQYLAEAGARWALYKLKTDSNYTTTTTVIKNIGTSTEGTYTVVFTGDLTHKTITSTGMVKGSKLARKVVLNVSLTSSSGVYNKYITYSKGGMYVNNDTILTGDIKDIGSDGSVNLNSNSEIVSGVVYVPKVPVFGEWDWNKKAAHEWKQADPAGQLTVSIPTEEVQTIAYPSNKTGMTDLKEATSSIPLSGTYYYDGSYTMSGTNLTANKPVIIHINGNLHLTSQESSAKFTGDNVTFYVTGDVLLDNACYIAAVNPNSINSNLNIYTNGTMKLTNTSYLKSGKITLKAKKNIVFDSNSYVQAPVTGNLDIYTSSSLQLTNSTYLNAGKVNIQAESNIDFNSNSSINNDTSYLSATTKMYSNDKIYISGSNAKIGGSASLVEAKGVIQLSGVSLVNTIFVSDSGESNLSSATIGGFYTNGSLKLNSSVKIVHKQSLIQTLDLSSGSSSSGLTIDTYNDQ